MNKCTICNGTKYVYGMGNMREKCKDCDGKGFVPEIKILKSKTLNPKKSKEKLDDRQE